MQALVHHRSVSAWWFSRGWVLSEATAMWMMQGSVCQVLTWSCCTLCCTTKGGGVIGGGSAMHTEVPLRRFAALFYLPPCERIKAGLFPVTTGSDRWKICARCWSWKAATSLSLGALIVSVGLHAFSLCESLSACAVWCGEVHRVLQVLENSSSSPSSTLNSFLEE